jgi:hypothetical protein
MKLRFLLLTSLIGFLSSCGLYEVIVFLIAITPGPPEAVNFNTDPRILRGSWVMKLTKPDQTPVADAAFNFSATYNTQTTYGFSGSSTIEDVGYNLTGVFDGGQEQTFVKTQTSAIRGAFAQGSLKALSNSTELSFTLDGYNPDKTQAPKFSGRIFEKTVTPENSEQQKLIYGFQLIRQ